MPVVGRLKQGTTVPQAQQELEAITGQLAREYPQANLDRGVMVVSLPEQMVGHVRPALLVLLSAVGVVLLIACSNVATFLALLGCPDKNRRPS
jgi:putative ABC transport system permease protein